MPTYAYKCTNCGHTFDYRQRISDDPLTDCPVCGGRVRRVINQVGLVFKGSGFYVTDNRNGSSANGKASGEKANTDKKTETPAATSSTEPAASSTPSKTDKPATTAAT